MFGLGLTSGGLRVAGGENLAFLRQSAWCTHLRGGPHRRQDGYR